LTMFANHSAWSGGCDCQSLQTVKTPMNNLRRHYESIRKSFNPALSRVVSEHLQTRVDWDSPLAAIMRSWVRYVENSHSAAIIARLSDITIDLGASLRVDRSTKSLLAGTI